MDRSELEGLDREGLVLRAQAAGIRRARVLTRPELIDELLRLDPQVDATQLKKTRGFFGRARDLLSRVVERGLHLPETAEKLRAIALGEDLPPQVPRPEPQAVPTVTLAEIYAAQGHKQRAIETLRRVLEAEPDHGAARSLLAKLEAADYVAPKPPLPPEPAVQEQQEEEEEEDSEIGAHLGSRDELPKHDPDLDAQLAAFLDDTREPSEPEPEPEPEPETTPYIQEPPTLPRSVRTHDECVAIPFGEDGSYVWWRLTHATRERIEEKRFVVRALVIVPSWEGPKQVARDVACELDEGELSLRGFPANAVVRIAVGWLDSAEGSPTNTFVPLAHSPAIEMTASRELVCWTVAGVEAIEWGDPNYSSIARAREGATRAGLV